jgi:6-phosphogluconolactonase
MAVLTIVDDEGTVAMEAAERLTRLIEQSIAARGCAVVSLTGGSTPRRLYVLIGDTAHPWRARIDWRRVHLFWSDERHVPPDDRESNFGMANETLVRHVPIPRAQVYRMHGELANPEEAARVYDRSLAEGFAAAGRTDRTFDVMHLGMGEDAHIASIFPYSPLLGSAPGADPGSTPPVAAVWVPHLNAWRLTLTPAALLDSREIVVVVAGGTKAEAMRAALELPGDVRRWPAQLLRSAGDRVTWIIDRAAAAALRSAPGVP